jgi:hypothetical protein
MSEYSPNKWLVIKIIGRPSEKPVYKIFGCWYGGYLGSDSWQLNSGITSVSENTDYYFFEGSSGSTYSCRKGSYGANGYGYGVLEDMIEKAEANDITIEVLTEETKWMELNYEN